MNKNHVKSILLLSAICSFIVFTSCEKSDTFTFDGYYSGSFIFQGKVQFDGLIIHDADFEEAPSGGAAQQKFPCLTKGTYSIRHNVITFTPYEKPDCLCPECMLNGDYTLFQSGKNIIFQKGTGDKLQVYNFTLIEE